MPNRVLARSWSLLVLAGLLLLVLPGNTPPPEPAEISGQLGSGIVQVYVSGAVRHPGLYRLPVGTRVIQAIHRSGGLLPGTPVDQLALTRLLVDGEQIHVAAKPTPAPEAAGDPPSGQSASVPARSRRGRRPVSRSSVGLIRLNQASIDQLDALPGIGRKRAADIVAYRSSHGAFRRLEDLRQIPGIGPKMLQRLRPHLKL